ncbi:MAG: hypothetical protein ACE5G8_17365 [Anaerolineae bacterium]
MSDQTAPPQPPTPGWGRTLQPAACPACEWSFLLAPSSRPRPCPPSFRADLASFDPPSPPPNSYPPELTLPFTVSPERLAQAIQTFAANIPFSPADLKPSRLQARLQRVRLPMWLVDTEVQATWQAEAGFNYQVVSHHDRYRQNRGGWQSEKVTETRVRWEPRVGRLKRTYPNIALPAVEAYPALKQTLGPFNLESPAAYRPAAIDDAAARLPDRPPQDAWPDAIPVLQTAAGDDCCRAARADHLRGFSWQPEYRHRHWTQLLLPLYSAYYLDDDGLPQAILIHGQTGRVSGARRASIKRALKLSLAIGIAAAVIFLCGLGFAIASYFEPGRLVFAGLGLAASVVVGLAAVVPAAVAWQFNRKQTDTQG